MPEMKRRVMAPPWQYPQKTPVLDLGHAGDNLYTEVYFPIPEEITENRELHIYVAPDDGDTFEPTDTRIVDRHTFAWRITAEDTRHGRAGQLQVWMTDGASRGVMYDARYKIHSSID